MPYKARLKTGEPRKRRKPGDRVTNARAYNQSLRKRGMISLYVPDGDLKAHLINARVRTPGVSGREPTYTTACIELIFTFYRLFGWRIRQITGYMEDYWATRGLDIPVPSASQLGERFASLEVSVTQRCEQLARRLARGETISLIVDSSGLSFGRASQWYEQKYGQKAARTPWRKMHLSIDEEMNVHALRITTTEISDSEGLDAALPAEVPLDRGIADGGYFSIARPGVLRGWDHQITAYIKEKGIHAFQKKYGYGVRSLVEAQISRIKRCIGERLLTQKLASQEGEGVVIANLVNLWNSFGRCVCVKNG